MADRDVVIEAVVENEEVKTKLYRDLQPHLGKDAILASNTSTISIAHGRSDQQAGKLCRPALLQPGRPHAAGRGDSRRQDQRQHRGHAGRPGQTAGQEPHRRPRLSRLSRQSHLFPYINESLVLLEEGADPRLIDKAAVAFGMPMGPITLNDLVGLDTALYAGRVVNTAFADRARTRRSWPSWSRRAGSGRRAGAGFYRYGKDGKGADDPALAAILQKCRTGRQRSFEMEEITDRLFLPMLVEASLVLSEGIVRDPADVDMGLILGIGFPAFRGGILRWADTMGLDKVLARLGKYEASANGFSRRR